MEKEKIDFIKIAKQYSKSGFSVIPVTSEKIPAIRDWSQFQTRPMTEQECETNFKNCWGIALLCGGVKKITGFDADLKYDLSGDIFERFKNKLPNSLLKKMYVQKTKNDGYHILFSCDKVEPNQKLASRYTTPEEKHQTYMESFEDVKTRDKALRIASNDKTRIIFETRGGDDKISGGYVVMSPSPGYEFVYGKISHISIEEYDLIIDTARSFNDVVEERKDVRLDNYNKDWTLSPFADFNEKGDVLQILFDNGWEEVKGGNRKSVRLKRPGKSSSSSALYDTETRLFNCFSTSTGFDVNRAYTPSDVLIELECEGDLTIAFKKLIEMGYGEK